MPTENSVRKLALIIDADIIDQNMARHSRNAKLIAERVQDSIRRPVSFVSEVFIQGSRNILIHETARGEFRDFGGGLRLNSISRYWQVTRSGMFLAETNILWILSNLGRAIYLSRSLGFLTK